MTNEAILKPHIKNYDTNNGDDWNFVYPDDALTAMTAARLDERERMITDGWRQCAQGQKETQFCAQLEAYKAEILKSSGLPTDEYIDEIANEEFPAYREASSDQREGFWKGANWIIEKAAPIISNLKDELARSVQDTIGLQLKIADQRIEFEKLAEQEREKSERFAEWCYTWYFLVLPGEDKWISPLDKDDKKYTTAELRAIFDKEEGGNG